VNSPPTQIFIVGEIIIGCHKQIDRHYTTDDTEIWGSLLLTGAVQTLACKVSRDDFKQVLCKKLLTDTGCWQEYTATAVRTHYSVFIILVYIQETHSA
jgi:hypothetical protein